eukprot:TRINITY_DN26794_c0_g4_i1.p2 TRINITY_DN26794_c0_g4~~TRINITY_DN26794_c0_g4_i1.p2  ORF type:complete len:194 (-),score=14.78 TRINITY_DN26794_c0_g4_i1:187-768(-)
MSVVGWKSSLLQSLDTNRSLVYARYFQIATLRPNGVPANRTVVFRGFLGESDSITFITDSRSKKVEEIAHNPFGEICWYFPNSREQYRISGELKVIDESYDNEDLVRARQNTWRSISENARKQFLWPHPGLPREPNDEDKYDPPALPQNSNVVHDFCLVVMEPQDVDHVLLFTNQRFQYSKEQGIWKQLEINP